MRQEKQVFIILNRNPDETNKVQKQMKTNVKTKTHFNFSILFGFRVQGLLQWTSSWKFSRVRKQVTVPKKNIILGIPCLWTWWIICERSPTSPRTFISTYVVSNLCRIIQRTSTLQFPPSLLFVLLFVSLISSSCSSVYFCVCKTR